MGVRYDLKNARQVSQPSYEPTLEERRAAIAPVTPRQARLALLEAGKLADVDAALATLPSPQKEAAQIEWEYATEVQRGSALIASLGPALGLDDDAVDALFENARTK